MIVEVYLLVLAIANLITEQNILRIPIMKLFGVEDYQNWGDVKRFIFDLLSCGSCTSFWVGSINGLIIGLGVLGSIKIGLIAMFLYAVLEKLKR
jgi:hypothetical protein